VINGCVFFVNLRAFSSIFVRLRVGGRTKSGQRFARKVHPEFVIYS
jgi:hypothetical protein